MDEPGDRPEFPAHLSEHDRHCLRVADIDRAVDDPRAGRGEARQIAADLALTPSTTHTYITDLFRKFGVSGRAGLTALWLGKPSGDRDSVQSL